MSIYLTTTGTVNLLSFGSVNLVTPAQTPVQQVTFGRFITSSRSQSCFSRNVDVYMAGYYSGSSSIKNEAGSVLGSLRTTSSTNSAFLTKFGEDGTYVFSRVLDSDSIGYSVVCDSNGNMYFLGQYSGTPVIYDGVTPIATLPASTGGGTAFLIKFDPSGVLQYSRILDSSGSDDVAYSGACDSVGNVYFSGFYKGTGVTVRGTTTLVTLPNSLVGNLTGYVCKLDSGGNFQFARIFDGNDTDIVSFVFCDSADNFYTAGSIIGNSSIYNESGSLIFTLPIPSSSFNSYGLLCKFNSSGVFQYARLIDGLFDNDFGACVTRDTLSGVYISGLYYYSATIKDQTGSSLGTLPDGVGNVGYVCKFDSVTGAFQYAITVDDQSPSSGDFDYTIGVACDSKNNMYMCGLYNSAASIRFVNSSSVTTLIKTLPFSSSGSLFMCKFDSLGTFQYARLILGSNECTSVRCDASDNVYVSGTYVSGSSLNIIDENGSVIGTIPASTTTNSSFLIKFTSDGNYNP